MATKSFLSKINAMLLIALACMVTLISCKDDDLDDTGYSRQSIEKYSETSNLTVDNYYGSGNLAVVRTYTDSKGVSTEQNGDATAKCTVSPESDPVETAHKDKKEFTVGKIEKSTDGKTVTCDITVNGAGQENILKCRVALESATIFGKTYSIDVKNIHVDEDNVQIVETSKKQGELGRQAVKVPVVFTLASNGTELDGQEDHQKDLTVDAIYEQFQKQGTPEVDHEEFDHAYWKVNPDFSIDYMIVLKQIWTNDHEDTYVEYPYNSSVIFNVIEHEDKTVKSWAYGLSNIEGLTVGTPVAVESKSEFFTEKRREDIYSAIHANGQDANIKCVYFCEHPEVTFTKGDLSYTFNFVSPSFSENSDDLLDGTSMKSGYDLKIFRNAVTGKYGNQESGIQEKVLEERCNLYKAAKAVADVEFSNMKKSYSFGAIQYDVDCIDVYNDGTKSEKYHVTTSRPWSINYQGAWSMNTDKDVNEVIDAIKVSKTSKTYEPDVQTISNGKWTLTQVDYDVKNNTTVAGTSKENYWKSEKFPAHMVLTIHGKTCDFGEDIPTGTATNDQISLTSSTATEETYTFSETLNFKVGDYTHKTDATGVVKKAVEVTVTSWEWNARRWVEGKTVKAFVERIYHMSDGSTKTVRREFTGTINSNCYTYFETTEVNNSESTGAAEFVLVNTESKTDGDWKFDYKHSQLNFGITYAGSTQKDGWNIYTYDNLSCTIDGETYTFTDALDMSATANSTQTKKSEDDSKTTYEHSNAATFYFGGSAIALDAAKGLVFVNKTVVPTGHDGFFPKEYGKIEGYNRVACRNPHNQKDWGVGISVKFTNGSICGFITKDGSLEWGSFEAGSTTWDGASPDGNGTLMNVTAKDASTAMKWRRGDSTINMMSYSDGTLMGFNWGHNTVYTDHFGGNIEQKDGGKYQILTISGVNGSWDSSY